ncbi:hypothetical protein F7725_022061, partial [Dissostichus mawsoni]
TILPSYSKNVDSFSSDTLINNVVTDPRSGRLYVGAVNHLYQLTPDLQIESHTETGPKRDNRQCTPPVTDACEEAVDTDNHNKLILVQEGRDTLVVCGSVYRGICSLRNLSNVQQLLYFSDSKGEKSYVASAEESVSVVGKGYGSHDRFRDWVVFDSIIEASAVQANPFVLRYLHDFRFAFKDDGFVYFLFSRTLGVQDTKNFTFVSRMCEDNQGYYSYTELQLNCSHGNKYNKAQAAYVTAPGDVLAQNMTASGEYGDVSASDKVLHVPALHSINKRLVEIIGACYSHNGIINEKGAVYSPYSSKSEELCSSKNHVNMTLQYGCGAEFLPSPLASKAEFALTSEPPLARKGHMTAVAVAVEMRHAVAFLGTSTGEVLKVHLSAHPEVYGRAPGDTGEKVNKNLLFDTGLQHLYITTEKKISKVPVQSCHLKTDCLSCVSMKDPYCGWCVHEDEGVQQVEREQHLAVVSQSEVDIYIPALPALEPTDWLRCEFGNFVSRGVVGTGMENGKLTCALPDPVGIPPTTQQQDYVSVPVKVVVNDKIEVTSGEYHFYNCAATVRKNQNTPCIACVTSEWRCQWNAQDHSCSDESETAGGEFIVKTQQDQKFSIGTNLMKDTELMVIQEQGSKFKFNGYEVISLYNCSVNREDCSLCKNAASQYECVWCSSSRSCVYRELCPSHQPAQCPPPEITDINPRFGPLNGRISVTIGGSNMGIKSDDVRKITVAGVDCLHQEERYSVSTRRVPPSDLPFVPSLSGAVEVELIIYLALPPGPQTLLCAPKKGPAAGGTVITIKGEDLDTATKDDISCKTGKYRGQKVPSECLVVAVKYGTNTTKEIPSAYQYSDNPRSQILTPRAASCGDGGRRIVVLGSGFDLIQRATMEVLSANDEFSQNTAPVQFLSPAVNCCVDSTALRSVLWLDDEKEELKGFDYHPDPSFNQLLKNVITETSIIIVHDDKLILEAPSSQPRSGSKRQRRDTTNDLLDLVVKFGHGEWKVGSVYYAQSKDIPLEIIIPSLENLEESVRDRCKKEFTDLMIEMEDHTSDLSEARIPFLDYKMYTDRNFFLPTKDGSDDTMITGKIKIPEARKAIVAQALNQFSNLLNSKPFLINFIRTLESRPDFNARARGYFASLLTVALHGKLEYYTDIMRTLLLELMDEHVETVVERMLFPQVTDIFFYFSLVFSLPLLIIASLKCPSDTAGEPLYKLFKALKHQVEKGPVDAKMKKAKYTLNDTGLLGDDVEYSVLTLQVLVHGEGPDVTPVKVLSCDSITQWRPGSTGQILSDLDLTSQKEGRWKRLNTLAHYNSFHQHQDNYEETVVPACFLTFEQGYHNLSSLSENALLEDDHTFHLVRPADEMDEGKSKRGSMKDKSMTKAITEIYLTRLLSVKFVDDFFRSVLCSGAVVPPAVKYFFDFLDEQAERHDNVDEETLHIWKTNSLPLRFWVNILRNPQFIVDVHESPSNKLLYAKEISTYKKMVDDYYKGIREMVPISDQDMNTHLAEVSRQHTHELNTELALHQLYQYASKYYDVIIKSLDEDPAAQNKQLTLRLQQIAAALENKVTDL